MENEIWKPIPGYEDRYSVSNYGRIMGIRGRPRKLKTNNGGYSAISLNDASGRSYKLVHVLVANAFLGPKPSTDHEVNHKNGIKTDNAQGNLEWVTKSENIRHAWATGLIQHFGDRHWHATVPDADVLKIRQEVGNGANMAQIARRYGVSRQAIFKIVHGIRRKRSSTARSTA